MPRFNIENVQALKDALYNSCFHDARITSIKHDYSSSTILLEAVNVYVKKEFKMEFHNVETLLATKGDWICGNSDEIVSLSLENDFSYLRKSLTGYDKNIEMFLYLLFQTFSGDEIHVVCKEVSIDISTLDNK